MIKKIIKDCFQKFVYLVFPIVKVNHKYNFKVLGKENDHYFVGYYDKDPVNISTKLVLCHKVSNKYSNMVEPTNATIGLLSIEDNSFKELTSTNAMNWQLGSRAQWLNKNTIIFNDIDEDIQCSIKYDISTNNRLIKYKRPFWDISPNKKFGASLNFSRIRKMRPGYGYSGKNIDDFREVLTIFSLENDSLIYSISLEEILQKVKYDENISDEIYLNHIVWSPSSKKLITIFNFENKRRSKRMVYPVLINLESKKIEFLHKDGSFSHHTFVNEDEILAYLKINNHYCFGLWSKAKGWTEIKNSMPKFDGHPTYINSSDNVVVDSYSDRLGVMSLYLGSINPGKKLEKIASIINDPQYKGPIRCDLHPRVSLKHNLIVCDLPLKSGRKILVVKDVLNKT